MDINLSHIPASQAALEVGESPTTKGANISARARAGKIPGAVKMGRDWLIPKEWVEAEKARRKEADEQGLPKRGRPRNLPPEMT